MGYRNWPMTWKVISLILTLAVVSLGGGYYATSKLLEIDDHYSDLLDHPAMATVKTARIARFAASYDGAVYANIAAITEEEKVAARADQAEAIRGIQENIADAVKLVPDFKADFDAIGQKLAQATGRTCVETIKLANMAATLDNISKAASLMNKDCSPALDDIRKMTVATNDRLLDHLRRSSDGASATSLSVFRTTLTAIVVATFSVIGLGVFAVRRGVVAPIRESMDTMAALGRGELGHAVTGTDRGDELGAMARSLELLRNQLQDAERMRVEQAAREEGERQLLARRDGLAKTFVARMQDLAQSFSRSSGEVAASARNLSATAEETARQAQSVSSAAEEAASNVQTVAASAEEMASSVREISGQVNHSAHVADTAFSEAEASNARIGALASAASAIGDVINLIKGIADQTNLLALNATIEAARAGEAGKGFAVVAAEVKQLATQTARATEEIGAKVGEIQQATDGTVKSMTEIVRVIGDIKAIASAIAGAVEEQGAATGEIARNCQQAAAGAGQVTENIAGVGQAAEMTGSASTQLMTLSTDLSGQAVTLRETVEGFVRDLAAA